MAVPKKKVSRSRRDQRRYSGTNQLDPVTWVTSPLNQECVRPHRVTLETIDAYLSMRKQQKSARIQKSQVSLEQ